MNVTLVYPPAAEVRQPYPALPALAAYLEQYTDARVELLDANIEAFHHFTSPMRLRLSVDRLRSELAALEQEHELTFPQQKRYLEILNILFEGPSVARRTEEARDIMRDRRRFLDAESYHDAVIILNRALQLISTEHPPSRYDSFGFRLDGRETRIAGLLEAIADNRVNPFLDYFDEETVPRILNTGPGLVGISIGYIDQLLSGLTLARLLRRAAGPDLYIVAGGAVLLELSEVILGEPRFFDLVDAFILHDGEEPLRLLLEALPERRFHKVPNLIRREGDRIVKSGEECLGRIREYPTPAYERLPLDKYLTPEVVYHLQSSRGCYWNKCAFCTRPVVTPDHTFRKRPAELVLRDVDRLRRTVNARHFAFYDDSVPPATLAAIADHLARHGSECRWYAEVKFETIYTREFLEKLKTGGCRMLFFGLESASQRLLDLMEKGMNVAVADRILDDCEALGIPTVLGWFVGFPGETPEDHRQTLEFIEKHRGAVIKADPLQFSLYRHSKVFRDPERYGITRIELGGRGPLALDADYEVKTGLMNAEDAARLSRQAGGRLSRLGLMEPRSESHLFLAASWSEGNRLPERSLERFLALKLKMTGEVEERRLAFPLDRIITGVRDAEVRQQSLKRLIGPTHEAELADHVGRAAPPVSRSPFPYRYHPLTESKLTDAELEVIEFCDGRRTIGEVMEALQKSGLPISGSLAYSFLMEALRKGVLVDTGLDGGIRTRR